MEKKAKRKSSRAGRTPLPNLLTITRAAFTAAFLIIANTLISSVILRQILLIVSLIISGFDLLLSSVDDFKSKDYFSSNIIVSLVVIVFYIIGCHSEAVIGLVVYQLGQTMYNYAISLTKHSFYKNAAAEEADIPKLRAIMAQSSNQSSPYEEIVRPYFEVFEKAAIVLGLLFAIILPLISDMTYVMSIRRGLMLIAASFPFTIFISLRFCNSYALCFSAEYGVKIEDSSVFDKLTKLETIIFDKTDVFSDGSPKLTSVSSPAFDNNKFLMLAAYIASNSQQKIAAPIVSAYGGDIKREVVSSFTDYPGCGMEASINGVKILLGNKQLLEARGISLTPEQIKKGYVLYMVIDSQYAGSITFNEEINPYASAVISDFKGMGNIKSVMLTEDSNEFSRKLAARLNIDEVYGECDELAKVNVVQEFADAKTEGQTLMYVNAENTALHSAADIDAKLINGSGTADITTDNIGLFGLPVAYMSALRLKQLSRENVIFTILVKLLIVVLAITGNATLWFIMLLDFAAGIGTIMNVSRLTDLPIIDTLKDKMR